MALTKKQLALLKDKILAERERLVNSFSVDEEKYILNSDETKDEVDQASADIQRSQLLRFRNRDIFYAKKLEKAFKKIDAGDYGECEECGDYIRYERLAARPTAELCITCKDESEREELSNFIARQSKSLGKKIDLVINL